jgi:hypothetical protein
VKPKPTRSAHSVLSPERRGTHLREHGWPQRPLPGYIRWTSLPSGRG